MSGLFESNFDIPSEAQPLGTYDYGSIMHQTDHRDRPAPDGRVVAASRRPH
jgi:hypothetical protein